MDCEAILALLQQEYSAAGFSEIQDEENLVFSKPYSFTDADGAEKKVTLLVKYRKKWPILPPELFDPEHVFSSMHSLSGFQCWARFSDIFQQTGLGVIGPDVIEAQIVKLINAHVVREYYTVGESPEFAAFFEANKKVDHAYFEVDCDVFEKVIRLGEVVALFETGV